MNWKSEWRDHEIEYKLEPCNLAPVSAISVDLEYNSLAFLAFLALGKHRSGLRVRMKRPEKAGHGGEVEPLQVWT